MASIEICGVDKMFGLTHVPHDLGLGVTDGEFLVLDGPFGCKAGSSHSTSNSTRRRSASSATIWLLPTVEVVHLFNSVTGRILD